MVGTAKTGCAQSSCPWLIAGLLGTAPFLVFYLVVAPNKDGEWTSQPNFTPHGRANNPLDLTKWEFGPRIKIPSDKDRVEWPEQPMERQP